MTSQIYRIEQGCVIVYVYFVQCHLRFNTIVLPETINIEIRDCQSVKIHLNATNTEINSTTDFNSSLPYSTISVFSHCSDSTCSNEAL